MSEQNKIEELLKVRYKVIADYPFSTFKVGEILFGFDQFSMLSESDFIKHPHIFKKLEWWEDRQESEMPEYVKAIWNGKVIGVYNVKRWTIENKRYVGTLGESAIVRCDRWILPSTAEEFDNQKVKQ